MLKSGNRFVNYLRRLGAGSLAVSIIIHVIIIAIATMYVISSVRESRNTVFQGGGSSSPASQHSVKMARTQPNLDVLTKRLAVDTPNAAISLPDLPPIPGVSLGGPSLSGTLGKGTGLGSGVGAGAGVGGLKGPIMPAFGFKDAQPGGSLAGTFYDFKQLRAGTPNPNYRGNINSPFDNPSGAFAFASIRAFINAGWSQKALGKFYQSPTTLYVTQIAMPRMQANEAPKAFGVADKVNPKAWMALYQGKVSPPQSGTYRFVGGGDDVLVVRFNGKVVLDAGLTNISGLKHARKYGSSLSVGEALVLNANQFYDIHILVSEGPGKGFYALLLFEQEGKEYKRNAVGPILPVFRVANTGVPEGSLPAHMPDGPIWRAQAPPKK